jgi:hypothetical protein
MSKDPAEFHELGTAATPAPIRAFHLAGSRK